MTGQRPALTSRTASDPIHRCPAWVEAPTIDGVGAHLVGHPPQFGVRVAAGDHEGERNAQPSRPLFGFPPQARACLLERLLLRGDRARPGAAAAPYMADGRST